VEKTTILWSFLMHRDMQKKFWAAHTYTYSCMNKTNTWLSMWVLQGKCYKVPDLGLELVNCDWVCLWLLIVYQLLVKEVGRIMSWLNASWAGLAFKVIWNVVLMAHITGMRSSCWADMVSRSWVTRWLERRRFPITWWVCSRIPLAWGFLTVVNLDQIPYDWRSSWNLAETNSVPLSCKQSTGWG
jgi:hypothetical protein